MSKRQINKIDCIKLTERVTKVLNEIAQFSADGYVQESGFDGLLRIQLRFLKDDIEYILGEGKIDG